MTDIITPFTQLLQELRVIDSFLTISISGDNPEEIKYRGDELQTYLARSGKIVADAKYHLNEIRKNEIMEIIETIAEGKLSAKVQNTLVDCTAREQQYLVDWADRINRTIVHQLDWCRSRLSYEKESLRQNMNMPQ